MADDEQQRSSLGRSLSARLRRKEQVARGEAVPEMPDEEPPAVGQTESDEEAALTDDELLAKYELEDPETIEDEAKLDTFLEGKFPDRIRQMALRRMWRLNPMFRFADEMVEYGENYTDAATVIDGMTTAYQLARGIFKRPSTRLTRRRKTRCPRCRRPPPRKRQKPSMKQSRQRSQNRIRHRKLKNQRLSMPLIKPLTTSRNSKLNLRRLTKRSWRFQSVRTAQNAWFSGKQVHLDGKK